MQGTSDPNSELLDAAALCGHLVPAGSVHAFSVTIAGSCSPTSCSRTCSRRAGPSFGAGGRDRHVMVLQALEGLSDRDAIQALRRDIAWKVAAGLSLADEGFHPTVLTLWRNKLRASDRPERSSMRSVP